MRRTSVFYLPEICQGKGLWRFLVDLDNVKDIQEMVYNDIFPSRGVVRTDEPMTMMVLDMFRDIKSMELKFQGYAICKGALCDEEPKHWVTLIMSYYMNHFTGNGSKGTERTIHGCPWESIANVNAEEDAAQLKKGIGRFQISTVDDVKYLVRSEPYLHIRKLYMEVFVGELISRIVRSGSRPLRFPTFGSKLLLHTASTTAQQIHCEYIVGNELLDEEEVKYFANVTGEKFAFLHVKPMGHMELSKKNGNVEQTESKLVKIPPFSVVFFRGDLPPPKRELMMIYPDEKSLNLLLDFTLI